MKKNKRIGYVISEVLQNPNKFYSYNDFCKTMDVAKSSLSEDIADVNEILEQRGIGGIVTKQGSGGGFAYTPFLSEKKLSELQEELCERISSPDRILGGGFLYTSDIIYDHTLVEKMGMYFAGVFADSGADYVVTVETKGVPIASSVAHFMNLPLVIVTREAKYSEGSTVSINYFSGSHDRIQKMSIAKRAVKNGTKALIIDDFMRGGGSLKGLSEILSEFDIEVVGTGVAVAAKEPIKKKINSYVSIISLIGIDEESRKISAAKE